MRERTKANARPTPALPAGEGGVHAEEVGAAIVPVANVRGSHGLFTADPLIYKKLKEYATAMRSQPTPAEHSLWKALRGNAVGTHFRRQHVLGRYIVDFVSLDKRLVVELDGDVHDHRQQEDAERTAWLNGMGYRVLRFRNEEVLTALDGVVQRIKADINTQPSLPRNHL